jgi:hypothetical protein
LDRGIDGPRNILQKPVYRDNFQSFSEEILRRVPDSAAQI